MYTPILIGTFLSARLIFFSTQSSHSCRLPTGSCSLERLYVLREKERKRENERILSCTHSLWSFWWKKNPSLWPFSSSSLQPRSRMALSRPISTGYGKLTLLFLLPLPRTAATLLRPYHPGSQHRHHITHPMDYLVQQVRLPFHPSISFSLLPKFLALVWV